jgi:hypothetical protein
VNAWRIIVGAVIVLLIAAVGFAFEADRHRSMPVEPFQETTPAMDLADEATRHTARWLINSESNHFGGAWLGASCSPDDAVDRFVLSRWDPGTYSTPGFAPRSAYLRINDRGGDAYFDAKSSLRDGGPRYGKAWPLNARQAAKFRDLLRRGGYFSLPPGAVTGACHSEFTTLESCIKGRYYGVARMCEWMQPQGRRPLHGLAEDIEAFLDDASNGETGRQSEEAMRKFD